MPLGIRSTYFAMSVTTFRKPPTAPGALMGCLSTSLTLRRTYYHHPRRLCRRSGSSATDSPHCSAGGTTTAQSNRDGYPRLQSWTKTSRESHHFARHFCAQVVFAFRKWRRTLLRFKPKAAKGADGFALADQQVTFLPSLLASNRATVSGPFNGWEALLLPSPTDSHPLQTHRVAFYGIQMLGVPQTQTDAPTNSLICERGCIWLPSYS